jgi:hypothetical protein
MRDNAGGLMIKRKAKRRVVVRRKTTKVVAKKTAKAAPKRGYDIHTGRPTGRETSAMQRLERLTEKYVAEGMSLAEARNRARAEMRANPRMDWRAG